MKSLTISRTIDDDYVFFFLASFPQWCRVRLFGCCSPILSVKGISIVKDFRFQVLIYSIQLSFLLRMATGSIFSWKIEFLPLNSLNPFFQVVSCFVFDVIYELKPFPSPLRFIDRDDCFPIFINSSQYILIGLTY